MPRLQRIHVLIIALVVIAGLAALCLMVFIKPRQNHIKTLNAKIEEEQVVADKLHSTTKKLDDIRSAHAAVELQWENVMQIKMSPVSLADTHVAMFELHKDVQTYADRLLAGLNADPDVRYTGSLSFPGFPWSPPSQRMEYRDYPQGNFRLRVSDYPELLEWLKKTEELPMVVLLGNNITISGPSPQIDVSIPATVYIFYRVPEGTVASIKATGGGSGDGGGGGGGRGQGGRASGRFGRRGGNQ